MGLFFGGQIRRQLFSTRQRVKIVEVGARDGLQNERKQHVPSAVKLKFIDLLRKAGLDTIEATSFVSPKWVPQMSDAKEVVEGILKFNDFDRRQYPVLIPNLKGFEMFHSAANGILKDIAVFASASETFSQKNTNCSIEDSLKRLKEVAERAAECNIRVRGYVSCIVGCPYEGSVDPDAVLRVCEGLLDMGCHEISLGDTIGVGTASEIEFLLSRLIDKKIPVEKLAIHCHDTYGQSLANILVALEVGLRTVDSSCAGLGGCPYAPGASGNVATEDVVYMLQGAHSKWECGVDLDKLRAAGDFITSALGIETRSKVARALVSKQQM